MRAWDNFIAWIAGTEPDARAQAGAKLPGATIGLPVPDGEPDDPAAARWIGGVIWPVDHNQHGGAGALSSAAFIAEYDADAGLVYMLDDLDGTRHQGAAPLRVGRNVTISGSQSRSGKGIVTRTAEFGTAGLAKNVFRHWTADLIAHHLAPRQPKNSSLVFDPDEDGRSGGLHYLTRVRKWVKKLCSGATGTPEEVYAPLLNFTANGDGTPAHGAAHFDASEATLSVEGGGPLASADDNRHRLGFGEAPINQGGINIDALWGQSPEVVYSPAEFIRLPYPNAGRGPFKNQVEWREDLSKTHKNYCGRDVPGLKRWFSYSFFREYGPPEYPPDRPPPEKPPDRPPPINPPAMILPPERPPSIGTPAEIEAPSEYRHPRPSEPDGEDQGEPNSADEGGYPPPEEGQDGYWLNAYGFTEEQWNRVPLVSHEASLPVYQFTVPQDGGERWPTVKTRHETLAFHPDGSISARIAAQGPGSVIDMPAAMKAYQALASLWGHEWQESQHARIIAAGKGGDDGTRVIDGRFGLGMRALGSPFVASGFEFRLDTSTSAATPDLLLVGKDENAGDSVTGVVVMDKLRIRPISAGDVATPTTGVTLFVDSGNGNALSIKDSGGTVSVLSLS